MNMTGEKPSDILVRIDERQQLMAKQFQAVIMKLDDTYNQTVKTNGRVTQLEKDHKEMQGKMEEIDGHVTSLNHWKSWVGGVWRTILIVAAIAGFIISTALHFL